MAEPSRVTRVANREIAEAPVVSARTVEVTGRAGLADALARAGY